MDTWAVEDNTWLQIPALALRSYWDLKRCETLLALGVLIWERDSKVLSVPGGYITHIEWMKPQHSTCWRQSITRGELGCLLKLDFCFLTPKSTSSFSFSSFLGKHSGSSQVWIPFSFPQVHSVISHQCRWTPTQSLLFLMPPHTFSVLWYYLSAHSGSQ